jgi:hypothetical protein
MGDTRPVRWRLLVLAAVLSVAVLPSMATAEQQRARLSATAQPTILVGAGDIASCASDGDEATAALVADIPGQVFTAGDNAYDNGSAKNYATCYDPSWGAFKDRTRPAAGNHEYNTADAEPYFDYFGAAAGPRGLGYYSYDLDRYWHVVVLAPRTAAATKRPRSTPGCGTTCARTHASTSSPSGITRATTPAATTPLKNSIHSGTCCTPGARRS